MKDCVLLQTFMYILQGHDAICNFICCIIYNSEHGGNHLKFFGETLQKTLNTSKSGVFCMMIRI